MPRIRSIKPEFWTAGQIIECSLNARLLFIGLWNFCDDEGRHPHRPKQIKAQIFPADDLIEKDIQGMLLELSTNGLITIYTVDNQEYLQVNGWHHQRIDKPQPAKYPPPLQDVSENIQGTFPPDRIGKDTIGEDRDRGKPPPSKHRIPKNFSLTDELITYAAKQNVKNRTVLESFTDSFITSCQSKGYKYADFNATWKNWLRRDIEQGKILPDPKRHEENF